MRVVVLGAGVIGVTAAYELARDGHEVVVVERRSESALETSFANAGLIAPGHAYTWASPRAPGILWRSLFDDRQALQFRLRPSWALWSWSAKFLLNCTAEKARLNTQRKVRLCIYSQARMEQIAADTGVAFDAIRKGLLYLYRSPASFERGAANTKILSDEGLDLRAVGTDEAVRLDPSLAPVKDQFAGAVYCPSDASGDCHLFTQALARYCAEKLGVQFRFDTEALGFETSGDAVNAVVTSVGKLAADHVVPCLGVLSPFLAWQLGVHLPVYPIKGYSVTVPIDGPEPATIGGVDEDNLVAYARFGDRLRVTATAEFAGYDTSHKPENFRHMLTVIRGIFPNGPDYARPSYWACLRPMTPEGTPRFGRGRHRNVTFNAGHGHMGWTMAPGSARVVADLIRGREPAVDLAGMRVAS